ncbi:MAG: hypothetical protein ACLGHC_03925 [Alphaproteobacteria bacterium]
MPSASPPPAPHETVLLRFRRGMKWAALLSIAVAAAAVLLVAIGDEGINVHALIATALGAGLTVLLGTGLMMLVFLSSSSGHDDSAAGPGDKSREKE